MRHHGLHRGGIVRFDRAGLLVPGPAHMGHEDRPAAPLRDVVKGPKRGVDPVGVPDHALLDHVVIDPDENDFAFQVGILKQWKPWVDRLVRHEILLLASGFEMAPLYSQIAPVSKEMPRPP